MKQREKQIDKDAKQTEAEIQQFQLQKQSSLNTIDVVVPVSVSQLYVFENSGMFTGPEGPGAGSVVENEGEDAETNATTLKNCDGRTAVESMEIKSFVLFSEKALFQLQSRIGGLVSEIHDAKLNFKELHKERVKLEKARDVVRESIEGLTDKCSNLQMLKFGKLMDIDQLEAGNDKTKENEAQEGVKAVEEKHSKEVHSLTREMEFLRNDLAGVSVCVSMCMYTCVYIYYSINQLSLHISYVLYINPI